MMDQIHSVGTMTSSNTLREFIDQSARNSNGSGSAVLDDSVEISELATFLNRLAELPESRARTIVAVRNQILAGTYETSDKLDIATERLLTSL